MYILYNLKLFVNLIILLIKYIIIVTCWQNYFNSKAFKLIRINRGRHEIYRMLNTI